MIKTQTVLPKIKFYHFVVRGPYYDFYYKIKYNVLIQEKLRIKFVSGKNFYGPEYVEI